MLPNRRVPSLCQMSTGLPEQVRNVSAWQQIIPSLRAGEQILFVAPASRTDPTKLLAFIDRRSGTFFIWHDGPGVFRALETTITGYPPLRYTSAAVDIPDTENVDDLFTTPLWEEDVAAATEDADPTVNRPISEYPAPGGRFFGRCYSRSAAWKAYNERRHGSFRKRLYTARAVPIRFDEASTKWLRAITPQSLALAVQRVAQAAPAPAAASTDAVRVFR